MGKEQNGENMDMDVRMEETQAQPVRKSVSAADTERPVRRRPAAEGAARTAASGAVSGERPVRKRPAAEGAASGAASGERPVRKRPAAEGAARTAASGAVSGERPVRKRPAAEGAASGAASGERPVKKRPAADGMPQKRPVKKPQIEEELIFFEAPEENAEHDEVKQERSRRETVGRKPDAKKKKKKKKGGGLGILLIILLILIGVLGFFVWQLNEVRNGGTPVWEQLFNNDGDSNYIPTIITEEQTTEEVTIAPVEDGSSEEVWTTEEPSTEDPTVPQTWQNDANGNLIVPEREAGSFQTAPHWTSTVKKTGDKVLDTANYQAAMYDYDKAIATIQAVAGYESNQKYVDAIASYEQQKSLAVKYASNSTIPHVFFHSLIVDTSRAFDHNIAISNQDGVDKVNDYNYVMTTVKEYVRILESMYEDGYVLVSIYDIAAFETAEDGTQVMKHQPIYLPEGKKPFVLSIDDVSYYEYMTGHGYATKLVVGEDGTATNEYVLEDGSVIYGSFDASTILDDFVETHPDFSYRGAKGIIALTGYEGILGYRTCDYWYNDNCEYFNPDHAAKRAANKYYHNENMEADKAAAKAVAEALKADGWLFASHTWGHNRVGDSNSYEFIEWDTMMWEREVEPLIGDTDIIIFPQGEDLYTGSWRGYDPNNAKYQLMKSVGFDYFCNVDSNLGWTQLGSDHFRMARTNLDGQRMWEALRFYQDPASGAKNRLETLFDVREIFDWSRPTPVTK